MNLKITIGFLLFFLLIGFMAITKPQIHAQAVQSTTSISVPELQVQMSKDAPKPKWTRYAKGLKKVVVVVAWEVAAHLVNYIIQTNAPRKVRLSKNRAGFLNEKQISLGR